MLELPFRAKALVIGSVFRTSLIWAVPFVALFSSPWLIFNAFNGFDIDEFQIRLLIAALIVPILLTAGFIVAFPAERFGDYVTNRIRQRGGTPTTRSVDLADQLGIATGEYQHTVMSVTSAIPNVAAIPGRSGTTVIVTTGAEQDLPRDDLEALMATQIVVASDPWVRVASTAQLLSAPRFALLFGAGFLNPILIPLCFLAFFGHRRGDMVRDMVADSAALRATRHPEPLARALYELRPAAPLANKLKVGLPGFMVDQFWVLSRRMTVTTTVSGMGKTRQWTTGDEIAAEMAMRSDRVLHGSRGDLDALFDVKAWKRAVKGLGTDAVSPAGLPIALTPDERARSAWIEGQLGPDAQTSLTKLFAGLQRQVEEMSASAMPPPPAEEPPVPPPPAFKF